MTTDDDPQVEDLLTEPTGESVEESFDQQPKPGEHVDAGDDGLDAHRPPRDCEDERIDAERPRRRLERRDVALVAGAVVGLNLISVVLLEPWFATNDDTAMWGIASGATYGYASDHLVFMNTLVGLVLRALYTLVPGVPWYATTVYLLQVVAGTVLVVAALSVAPSSRRVRFATAVLAVPFLLTLSVDYQFTATSIMLAGAGLVTYVAATGHLDHPRALTVHVGAGLLFGLGFLVRDNGAWVVAVTGLPLVTVALWRRRRRWQLTTVALGSALALIVAGSLTSWLRYRGDRQWQDYFEFNAARAQLHQTPRIEPDLELGEVLADVGWFWSDRGMFTSWFFTNEDIFTAADLRAILAPRSTTTGKTSLGEAVGEVVSAYGTFWMLLVVAAVTLGLVTTARARIILVSVIVWFGAMAVALGWFLRFPPRLAVPLFLVVGIGLVAAVGSSIKPWPRAGLRTVRDWSAAVTGVVAAGLALASIGGVVADRDDRLARRAEDLRDFEVAAEVAGPDGVIVNFGGILSLETTHPFRIERHPANDLEVVGLGWRVRTPPFTEQLRTLDLLNLELGVADRPDVVIAATLRRSVIYSAFLNDHYGRLGVLWPERELETRSRYVFHGFVTSSFEGGDLVVRGPSGEVARWRALDEPSRGLVEDVTDSRSSIGSVSGWAAHPTDSRTPDAIVVLADDMIAGYSPLLHPRDDVVAETADDGLLDSGFFLYVPSSRIDPDLDLRVIAIYGDQWTEVPIG